MDKKLVKEPDAHRYTLRIDGELASSVDYSVAGNSISFTHTFTNPKLRGQGFAADIVEFAVDDVESTRCAGTSGNGSTSTRNARTC